MILIPSKQGADYDEVLKEAQDLGYAEADPTADVEGHDVRAKIAILAKLAFGTTVEVETIPCMGITNISVVDFEYAKSMGCTIKLVGSAVRQSEFGEHDGALSVYVSPKLVPNGHLLASAAGWPRDWPPTSWSRACRRSAPERCCRRAGRGCPARRPRRRAGCATRRRPSRRWPVGHGRPNRSAGRWRLLAPASGR